MASLTKTTFSNIYYYLNKCLFSWEVPEFYSYIYLVGLQLIYIQPQEYNLYFKRANYIFSLCSQLLQTPYNHEMLNKYVQNDWICMDCRLSGSSDHGILQIRILECVVISFSRGSSWPMDQTQVSHIARRFFTI